MNPFFLTFRLRVVLVTALAASTGAPPALAQPSGGATETATAAVVAACERAARESVAGRPGQPVDVTFQPPPAVQYGLSGDEQIVLRGTGLGKSAAGSRSFTYNCNVDRSTARVVGLVVQAAPAPAALAAASARPPAEPDFSELSPAACESSAVASLKQRWPRVTQISFDPATRTFRQPSAVRAELHGSGRALPAPGAKPAVFVFDCLIDPRDGRVMRTSIS